MTRPWWPRERAPGATPALEPDGRDVPVPTVLPGDVEREIAELTARIPAFTPDWKSYRLPQDPGRALVRLFAEQLEEVRLRANRWPEKAATELLRVAGIGAAPARPASVILQLTLSAAARDPVAVPPGFAVAAPAADGGPEPVVFETERELVAFAGDVAEVLVQDGALGRDASAEAAAGQAFDAFARAPGAGAALWLGLSGDVAPADRLSLLLGSAAPLSAPAPAAAGAPGTPATPALVHLTWEAFDGGAWIPMPVVSDDTADLRRTGVVELAVPARWRPGRPAVAGPGPARRWLRVRVVRGGFERAVRLALVRANCVRALAVRSVRDEVPEHVPGEDGRRLRLRSRPVVPGSLVLEVDDGRRVRRWREVDSLADHGPDDEVFVLDPEQGEIHFGDGVHGALVPEGFRNVVARRYHVGSGRAGAVDAGAVNELRGAAPFVTRVENPLPASGGVDAEPTAAVLAHGPERIRARGRAVALSDYVLLARDVAGAEVRRAFAISGFHPGRPGAAIPGVVGVLVVGRAREDGPPVPDEETLRAVSRYLAERLAPAGVEIVAAAPRFQRVRLEVRALLDRAADAAASVGAILAAVDGYLDPLAGGDDGQGWPFGAPIRHAALVRRILAVPGVRAVPQLGVVLDGLRSSGCLDHELAPYALLWPDGHQVRVTYREEQT
jgi:predicted phage baseplate assembly protein